MRGQEWIPSMRATRLQLVLVLCLSLFARATAQSPDSGDLQPLPPTPAEDVAQFDLTADQQQRLPTQAEWDSVLQRLSQLERELAESKAAAEATQTLPVQEPAKPAEKPAPAADDIEWEDLSNEKWTVKLGGHVQLDFVHWPDHSPSIPAFDYFEFRRLRLLADGTGFGVFDFRLQMDIEPEGGDGVSTPVTDVKDAYLTMNEVALFQRSRIGNFFVPFSLEQVTNDTNNIFMERSIPTQNIFSADREVGVASYGISAGQNFTWTFGTFLDGISESLKERINDNQGIRLGGRLTWLPYYDEPSKGRYLVHTGAGVLYTDPADDFARFRARPQVHEGPFLVDTGPLPANCFTTGNLEFATVWGPISFQSELFLSNLNLIGADPAILSGGYVYGSYFLTGENRIYERYGQHGAQFARNVPFSNFFLIPGGYGPGAWEMKARTSVLNLGEVDSGRYQDLTVGFNWYWTERIRIMFDWIHPWTSAEAVFGETQSDLIAMRFDFNW
jgi:phosphate-selective porin OprO/OprP